MVSLLMLSHTGTAWNIDYLLPELWGKNGAWSMSDLISRQDAIDALSRGSGCGNSCRKAIENLPSAEHHKLNIAEYIHDFYPDVWRHAEKELEVQPSAQRKGKWISHLISHHNTPGGYDCSACGKWFVIGNDTAEEYNYCPNCGADMRGNEEDSR